MTAGLDDAAFGCGVPDCVAVGALGAAVAFASVGAGPAGCDGLAFTSSCASCFFAWPGGTPSFLASPGGTPFLSLSLLSARAEISTCAAQNANTIKSAASFLIIWFLFIARGHTDPAHDQNQSASKPCA